MKSSAGLSTSLFSTSKAKEVLEKEERTRRGDQENDMMAASDDANCHNLFQPKSSFLIISLLLSLLTQASVFHPLFQKIRLKRRFTRGAQKVDMVATMEVGVCRKTFVSLSSSLSQGNMILYHVNTVNMHQYHSLIPLLLKVLFCCRISVLEPFAFSEYLCLHVGVLNADGVHNLACNTH